MYIRTGAGVGPRWLCWVGRVVRCGCGLLSGSLSSKGIFGTEYVSIMGSLGAPFTVCVSCARGDSGSAKVGVSFYSKVAGARGVSCVARRRGDARCRGFVCAGGRVSGCERLGVGYLYGGANSKGVVVHICCVSWMDGCSRFCFSLGAV